MLLDYLAREPAGRLRMLVALDAFAMSNQDFQLTLREIDDFISSGREVGAARALAQHAISRLNQN